MVSLKTQAEIEMMKKAGRIVALVFEDLAQWIKPGVSTLDLDRRAAQIISSEGAIASFLHYGTPPFPGSICASINEEVVHGIPSSDRILHEGDIVSVDVGAKLNGFHGDGARTFAVGTINEEMTQLIKVTEECFWKGFEQCQTGNRLGDVCHAIGSHAESFGYGVVRELTGHGIGRDLHEDPDVPNYGKKGHGLRISPGLVIAIEPMINMGSRNIELMSDQWTIRTKDKKPSAHYENTVAITADGPIITTKV